MPCRRTSFLFASAPLGAGASAVICSLIETAKEQGLDPHGYLLWVLKNAPRLAEAEKIGRNN